MCCTAHHPALAARDAARSVQQVKVSAKFKSIFVFVIYSAIRINKLHELQKQLLEPQLTFLKKGPKKQPMMTYLLTHFSCNWSADEAQSEFAMLEQSLHIHWVKETSPTWCLFQNLTFTSSVVLSCCEVESWGDRGQGNNRGWCWKKRGSPKEKSKDTDLTKRDNQ